LKPPTRTRRLFRLFFFFFLTGRDDEGASARYTAVWPFITVRDSLFNACVCTPRTRVYIRSRVGPSLKSFSLTSRIYCCGAYRYTTLLHRCRRVLLERFFFPTPPSPHTAPLPKAYMGITTTATGVFHRSWFSISTRITCTNNTNFVHTQWIIQ
jgi:hypothetical protein